KDAERLTIGNSQDEFVIDPPGGNKKIPVALGKTKLTLSAFGKNGTRVTSQIIVIAVETIPVKRNESDASASSDDAAAFSCSGFCTVKLPNDWTGENRTKGSDLSTILTYRSIAGVEIHIETNSRYPGPSTPDDADYLAFTLRDTAERKSK